ncbi:MAG: hypothetical protein IT385_10425 [Deltaproteobacteria bacterium]|nr:hypothetical protein [Deltaproteobacteria bacterium]
MATAGIIDVVDAAYDLEPAPSAWLTSLTRAIDRAAGAGERTVGLLYTTQGPPRSWIQEVAAIGLSAGEEEFLRRGYRAPFVMSSLARFIGPPDAMPRYTALSSHLARAPVLRAVFTPFARRIGFDDLVAIAANDGTGVGVIVNFIVDDRRQPVGAARRLCAALPHISAGLRLRRAVRQPELILDADGRLREGEATASDKERLRLAVRARDQAHTRAGRADPEASMASWTALIEGRWTLLDSFEGGGTRYVVAIPNLPDVPHPRGLTPVERAVLALMMLGHSNKLIGYDLGLSTATVGSHIRSIRKKLSADVLTGYVGRATTRVEPMRLGDVELVALVDEDDVARASVLDPLPAAEREVVRLALGGLGNAAIAQVRGVSPRTIANQLASAYRRLAVSSRRELAARVRRGG